MSGEAAGASPAAPAAATVDHLLAGWGGLGWWDVARLLDDSD